MKKTRINFCGTTWEIEENPINDEGQCFFDKQLIVINSNLHPHRKSLALVHELLHVVYDYVGVTKDEKLVRQIEHHVYDLINKFPVEYTYETGTIKKQ